MSRLKQDGKLLDRVLGAAIPVAISLGVSAVVWWRDSTTTDDRVTQAVARLERRLDAVEGEAKDARKAAADDRQKTAEIAGDVRNLVRSNARIEQLLDRYLIQGPPPRQP